MAKNEHFAPCRKIYALDQKMIATFRMGTTSSTTMQNMGEIELRAVGAKIWCLYVFFVMLRGRRAVRSRGYTLSRFCVAVYGSILMPFQRFSEWIARSDGLDSSHFCC